MKTHDRSTVLANYQLGSNQAETPEGYLFCKEVPIARIGVQQYLAEELPELEAGRDGIIHVERPEAEVFREETIRSFEGKDVAGDEESEHPDEMIGPDNYNDLSVGVILNCRRGTGALAEYLVADLLIKARSAIDAVRAGKREVSCGYDAQYEQVAPGRARQHTIIGNHVALVRRGRCGPSCAIGDHDMPAKKLSWFDRMMAAVRTGDEDVIKKTAEEMKDNEGGERIGGPGGVVVHVHGGPNGATTHAPTTDEEEKKKEETNDEMPSWFKKHTDSMGEFMKGCDERFKKVEDWMKARDSGPAEEVAEEEGEGESEGDVADAAPDEDELEEAEGKSMDKESKDKKGTKDADQIKARKQAFRDIVAGAEILAPGLTMPAFDAALAAPDLAKSGCLLKRRALAAHAKTRDGASALKTLTGAPKLDLKQMTCDGVGVLFNGAVAFAKDRNERGTLDLDGPARRQQQAAPVQNVAEFNRQKNEFWGKQNKH